MTVPEISGIAPLFIVRNVPAALAVALASVLMLVLIAAPAASAGGLLKPPGKKVYWGVSDTGDPADFGQFAAFLCSEQARYVTGTATTVDGGAYAALL